MYYDVITIAQLIKLTTQRWDGEYKYTNIISKI